MTANNWQVANQEVNMSTPTPPGPLLTVRAALVLLLGVLTGVAAGLLTFYGGSPWPAAVLLGASASGGATVMFHSLIG